MKSVAKYSKKLGIEYFKQIWYNISKEGRRVIIKRLSKEEKHKRNLEQLVAYRPLDDDFMRELFKDNLPLAQYVLRVITGIDDWVLTREETQADMKRLVGGRSICLDVFGEDSKGRKFDLEVQRAGNGARPKRARYHSSAMNVE